MADAAEVSRPIGRPRARRQVSPGLSPRDEIVAAATRLFAERGFNDTTMSEIARAAGLQQSSLYYWFRRKELILQATFAVNRLPLEFIERIGAGSGSPGLKLYRLLRFDALQLCLAPCDVLEVERLARQQPDLFAEYWKARQGLHNWVALLVRAGIDEGQFRDADADLVSLGLLSCNEGIQRLFRDQGQHATASGAVFTYPAYAAERYARYSAEMALRSILRRGEELEQIVTLAGPLDELPVDSNPSRNEEAPAT